jgi:hypothetical protein
MPAYQMWGIEFKPQHLQQQNDWGKYDQRVQIYKHIGRINFIILLHSKLIKFNSNELCVWNS